MELPLVTPPCPPQTPGLGQVWHEFKDSVDKGCVFHQLACLTCFIFCETVSVYKKTKETLLQKFTHTLIPKIVS